MSADNGVYILQTKDGYRVAHAQAIENISYGCKKGEWNEECVIAIFGRSQVHRDDISALVEAKRIYDNVVSDEICPICEYGICPINFKHKEFPETKNFYLAISNGDYNYCCSLDSIIENIQFEMNEGCQSWSLITKKQLTQEQYTKVMDALK